MLPARLSHLGSAMPSTKVTIEVWWEDSVLGPPQPPPVLPGVVVPAGDFACRCPCCPMVMRPSSPDKIILHTHPISPSQPSTRRLSIYLYYTNQDQQLECPYVVSPLGHDDPQ